jgi:hypothetical protein
VLDFVHRLTLRAAANGDGDDSPAMRSLVATGLVVRGDDGGYAVTPAGRRALEASKPSRWEAVLWPVLAVCAAILVVSTIIDWLG